MIIQTDETADIPVPGAPGPMRLHLFRPAIPGRFPGVVFYSEIYQVTAPIRRLAALLAGQGYVVAVPEVYHEYEAPGVALHYDPPGTERGNALKTTKPVAAYDADAAATLAYLRQHPACTGRLGTLGVCLGGHLAFRAALDPLVLAAACFYATDIHSGTLGAGKSDDKPRPAWPSLRRRQCSSGAGKTRTFPSPPPTHPRAPGGGGRKLHLARGQRPARFPSR